MTRRRGDITTLPGGARLTLRGYLPDRTCTGPCQCRLPAEEFLKTWAIHDGRRVLTFGSTCLGCEHPTRAFPADLRGARFTASYRDDDGDVCGWHERDRKGLRPEELSLESLQLRLTADGVFRPQPKMDRRSYVELAAHPRVLELPLAHPPTMIYFRQEREDPSRVKIGKGATRRRLRQTRSTDNPRELLTLLVIPETSDCTEAMLHARWDRWRWHPNQEWFSYHDEIRAFVEYHRHEQRRARRRA